MSAPSIPPPLHALEVHMQALHDTLRERTETGGSTHVHDPADLYASFASLLRTLDRVPTVVDLLLDHTTAWEDRGALMLTPLTPADHTVEEGLGMMRLAVGSASAAQEHTVRSLATLMTVLSHYSPNVAERGPNEPSYSMDDAHTIRDSIRHLQTRISRDKVRPLTGDYVSDGWLYLMLQIMGKALQEGRRADAVKTMTDPSISDGTWRPKLLALLVELAELIVGVQDNGREHLG
jgi:hypothetical protein